MDHSQQTNSQRPSVWSEYLQYGAELGLYGLSFFFSLPKESEGSKIQVLEGLTWNDPHVDGEMDVHRIADVVHYAMEPLKSMFIKGAIVTAALFFAGRVLSILPFVPATCYLFGCIALAITFDIYRAQQQMKYTFTHFNTMAMTGQDRISARVVANVINRNAMQSLCDMLLFSENKEIPRFPQYMAKRVREEETTLDPNMVTQMFFPALATIQKVAIQAQHFVERDEEKHQ